MVRRVLHQAESDLGIEAIRQRSLHGGHVRLGGADECLPLALYVRRRLAGVGVEEPLQTDVVVGTGVDGGEARGHLCAHPSEGIPGRASLSGGFAEGIAEGEDFGRVQGLRQIDSSFVRKLGGARATQVELTRKVTEVRVVGLGLGVRLARWPCSAAADCCEHSAAGLPNHRGD